MSDTIKEFTLGDFFDAMEKNGYPKSNGSYVKRDWNTGEVIEACAFGQAALNMSVDPTDLAHAISDALDTYPLPSIIYSQNDNTQKTVAQIAREFRVKCLDKLNIKFNLRQVG